MFVFSLIGVGVATRFATPMLGLPILLDELSVLVTHIVELVTIGFYSIVATIAATRGFILVFIFPISTIR